LNDVVLDLGEPGETPPSAKATDQPKENVFELQKNKEITRNPGASTLTLETPARTS